MDGIHPLFFGGEELQPPELSDASSPASLSARAVAFSVFSHVAPSDDPPFRWQCHFLHPPFLIVS